MNEPLASAAGNSVEVANAVAYLTGEKRDARLHAVTLALGGELLALGGIAETPAAGREAMARALASGAAAERFERMVAMLGGPRDFLRSAGKLLPPAPVIVPVAPARAGFVAAIDARAIGMAVVTLGGGRSRPADSIDHAVGFTRLAGLGAEVSANEPLALVHARDEAQARMAVARLAAAYQIGDAPPPTHDPVVARIAGMR
jgi:thymidine phosphorylase